VIWHQHWQEVLFLHFPIATDVLTPRLPRSLEVELFEGQAWLTYVFFRLKLRAAGVPFLAGLSELIESNLVELNVRTYVRHHGESGIYFLRMYTDNRPAILASRLLTPLCYERAAMIDRRRTSGAGRIECRPAALRGASLSADVEIAAPQTKPLPGSLDSWLVERYRLFVQPSTGPMLTATVEHPPWLISPVRLPDVHDSLSRALGLFLPRARLMAHYSPGVHARFNAFQRAGSEFRS
jgi:uncharacterized protein YqjF (DUF2071 family)